MFDKVLKFLLKPGPKYSWKKVVLLLISSSILVSGAPFLVSFFYIYTKRLHATDKACVVQAIVQTGPKYNALPTAYLAEILELSKDRPINLNQFSTEKAYVKLLACPLIKQVRLKKIKPNTLLIDYTVREPLAYLEDFENTVLDEEGVLFPDAPFFSPRFLPNLSLGNRAPQNPWGKTISLELLLHAKYIMQRLPYYAVKRIDLSQVNAPMLGRREIVIFLEDGKILRLNPKNYQEQLANYSILEKTYLNGPCIIDLRVPEVAYVQKT